MQREGIPIRELEQLLLDNLRKSPGCESVRQVTVIPRERDGDWICGCIQAGNLDPQVWRHALTKLEIAYREKFRLVRKREAPNYKVVKIGANDFWRG